MKSLAYLAGWFLALFIASSAVLAAPVVAYQFYLWMNVPDEWAKVLAVFCFLASGTVAGAMWWDYWPNGA